MTELTSFWYAKGFYLLIDIILTPTLWGVIIKNTKTKISNYCSGNIVLEV